MGWRVVKHGKTDNPYLVDTDQSLWSLTAIQLSGWLSLPILATSVLILQENSFLGASLTIIVGNAILWFIRLGIIAMSRENRESTLDLARNYLGNIGGYFVAFALLASTLSWFISQTTTASNVLTHLTALSERPDIDRFAQVSVLLGLITSFMCINGISQLRRLSTYAFPILIITFFVAIFTLPNYSYKDNINPLSLSGLSLVLATNLGVTADLPTFFRHSRSWKTSIKALLVIQLVSLGLGLCGLFLGSVINSRFEISDAFLNFSGGNTLRVAMVLFIFLSTICANVANVYSSSVGWEVVAPKSLVGRKEYLILGLSLTIIFILIANILSLEFLVHTSDNALVNLCVVLLIGYMVSKYQKKLPGKFEQTSYLIAWLFPTVINILHKGPKILAEGSPLGSSLALILLILSIAFLSKRVILGRNL